MNKAHGAMTQATVDHETREEGATGYNYYNRPEEARQERLQFDMDTGKLVVNDPPQEQAVVPSRHNVPDRPVLDKMASQGFFLC